MSTTAPGGRTSEVSSPASGSGTVYEVLERYDLTFQGTIDTWFLVQIDENYAWFRYNTVVSLEGDCSNVYTRSDGQIAKTVDACDGLVSAVKSGSVWRSAEYYLRVSPDGVCHVSLYIQSDNGTGIAAGDGDDIINNGVLIPGTGYWYEERFVFPVQDEAGFIELFQVDSITASGASVITPADS